MLVISEKKTKKINAPKKQKKMLHPLHWHQYQWDNGCCDNDGAVLSMTSLTVNSWVCSYSWFTGWILLRHLSLAESASCWLVGSLEGTQGSVLALLCPAPSCMVKKYLFLYFASLLHNMGKFWFHHWIVSWLFNNNATSKLYKQNKQAIHYLKLKPASDHFMFIHLFTDWCFQQLCNAT